MDDGAVNDIVPVNGTYRLAGLQRLWGSPLSVH